MFRHILLATDGSDLAQKAVDQGLELAQALGAKVTAVTISPPWTTVAPGEVAIAFPVEEYIRAINENAARNLAAVEESAKRVGIKCGKRHVMDQLPAEGILAAAKEIGCDLIVMASHGRRGLKRFLLGSQAYEVLTHSTIPVLIYR